MLDFAGFVTPLQYGAPGEAGDFAISIGGVQVEPGRVQLDVMAGLFSPGYLESRFLWIAIAVGLVVLAGLTYRPHLIKRRTPRFAWLTSWALPGAPPRANPNAAPARQALVGAFNLVASELRLIGSGRVFLILAAAIAIASWFGDFRHAASPAALLLLVFALSAHAGRSEARHLLPLTKVAPFAPMQRRAAFVIAGTAWTTLMAVPALVRAPSLETLAYATGTGGVAAATAILLATISGSSFAPRLVLLVLWYGYASS
jgi:hypothetical protein